MKKGKWFFIGPLLGFLLLGFSYFHHSFLNQKRGWESGSVHSPLHQQRYPSSVLSVPSSRGGNVMIDALFFLGPNSTKEYFIKNILQMEKLALKEGSSITKPWSGDYWPIMQGTLANRYQDPHFGHPYSRP